MSIRLAIQYDSSAEEIAALRERLLGLEISLSTCRLEDFGTAPSPRHQYFAQLAKELRRLLALVDRGIPLDWARAHVEGESR